MSDFIIKDEARGGLHMRINTNVNSLTALRALDGQVKTIEAASGRLSSGSRVRSAADDSAALGMSSKLTSHKRSGDQAIRNGTDAMSELQVAEGAMSEIGNILTRLRELSVQASTGTVDSAQRGMLNQEFMHLRQELDRIAQVTDFNGVKLLNSKAGTRDFQIGLHHDKDSRISVDLNQMGTDEINLGTIGLGITTAELAQKNLPAIDKAIDNLSRKRASAGAASNRLQTSVSNLTISNINKADANSRIIDSDMAYETSEKMRSELKMQTTSKVLMQANNLGQSTIKLIDVF